MPVYRTLADGRVLSSLFDTLVDYLKFVAKEATLSLHQLNHTSDPNYQGGRELDVLLVREGRALMAVSVVFEPSGTHPDYEDAAAYAGAASTDKGNLADMAVGLAERLKNELTPTKAKKEPVAKFIEARWAIVIRGPGVETKKWTGSPFDVETLEKAFSAIVDAIVARSK